MNDVALQEGKELIRTSILPAPTSDLEREERRALIYTILCADTVVSASSGWCNAIQYDELVSAHLSRETGTHCAPRLRRCLVEWRTLNEV